MRVSADQLKQMQDRIANGKNGVITSLSDKIVTKNAEKVTKPSKYKNVRGVVDGITFASMKEAEYYNKLKLLRESGHISWFLRQVPFHLPGNIKYIADFLVVYPDRVEVVDVKGFETEIFKLKHKLLEATYPIQLKVV